MLLSLASVTWDRRRRVAASLMAAAVLASGMTASRPSSWASSDASKVNVIVRELRGALGGPEAVVREVGGHLTARISLIDGFVAEVPSTSIARIEASAGVASVTVDRSIQLSSSPWDFQPDKVAGSMYSVAQEEIGAGEFWNDRFTGKGVGVALIDSGVVPVEGLSGPGKIINGPDLSFESQDPALRHLDTYGHGTHMAGIIAGRDSTTPSTVQRGDKEHFLGVAPDAHIVNVKVADAYGAADVSQVIAGIDWVVEHRNDPGLNIRVLNLSFGTDSTQSYLVDPLAHAVEVAWHKGIVVVVAAGNRGFGSPALNAPAVDPYVIAVGGATTDGKSGLTKADTFPEWSSSGDASRRPDLVAPGGSLLSLRAPGSYLDVNNPAARVSTRFFRGSGTSQSAAVVSGAAALLVQQRPWIKPDQVKRLLMSTSAPLPGVAATSQGSGLIDMKRLRDMPTPRWTQTWPRSTGVGSLELSRGSAHLGEGSTALVGEIDIFGTPWDPAKWSAASLGESAWSAGSWLGKTWAGSCWCGASWSGKTWASTMWTAKTWSGKTWASAMWNGKTWSGGTWTGGPWTGKTWHAKTWHDHVWSGSTWG